MQTRNGVRRNGLGSRGISKTEEGNAALSGVLFPTRVWPPARKRAVRTRSKEKVPARSLVKETREIRPVTGKCSSRRSRPRPSEGKRKKGVANKERQKSALVYEEKPTPLTLYNALSKEGVGRNTVENRLGKMKKKGTINKERGRIGVHVWGRNLVHRKSGASFFEAGDKRRKEGRRDEGKRTEKINWCPASIYSCLKKHPGGRDDHRKKGEDRINISKKKGRTISERKEFSYPAWCRTTRPRGGVLAERSRA